MVDWKQPDRAVAALAHARGQGAGGAKLLLCGEGPFLPEVRALAARLGVEGDCRFLGWTDPREAYHASDFLILTSRSEGFGLVCVEGMLCGLPVLRTRAGGCDLQILEGKTGWAVEVGDDAALFEKFLGAVRDSEGTKRCGLAARDHALANFTEEKFLDAMIRVYESVVPGTAGANA
jgi:glycosyltransferase involved in cell wall biosynthesis